MASTQAETHSAYVETPFGLNRRERIDKKCYFSIAMTKGTKNLLKVSYWIAAILLVASILTSLGYRFGEAMFLGTLFLPGALAVKFFFPKVSFKVKSSGIKNTIFIILGTIAAEILLVLVAHLSISLMRDSNLSKWPELPEILTNPLFIAIIIAALAVGNYYFEVRLEKMCPSRPEPVTFLSERKSITLDIDEILFIESNDDVTTVEATGDRHFRNKTPISQWEAILGRQFIRIHRSFLVNRAAISAVDVDTVSAGGIDLPISRKYKKAVSEIIDGNHH